MKKYIVVNQSNEVIGSGMCSEETFALFKSTDEKRYIEVEETPSDLDKKWLFNNGKLIDAGPRIKRTYAVQRMETYPTVGEQLDVLWKILEPMAKEHPEGKKMLDLIQGIKQKYPKEVKP